MSKSGQRPSMPMDIIIRTARPNDAEAIVDVHFAAVHGVPTTSYSPAVIDSWYGTIGTNDRIERKRYNIKKGEHTVVAIVEDHIVGFGSIVLEDEKLRALYVRPEFGKHGIGKAILTNLEQFAVSVGLKQLHLDASLNAEAFYESHGYAVIEHGIHCFPSGGEIACARMIKKLVDV